MSSLTIPDYQAAIRRLAGIIATDQETTMTDDQIKYMVDRFLNWKLPENWTPDCGITFEKLGNKGTPHQFTRNPVGTNLLDADQATAMVLHMIEGLLH